VLKGILRIRQTQSSCLTGRSLAYHLGTTVCSWPTTCAI